MQRLQNIFDDVWAALMMFTRLPWWRLHQPGMEHFRNTVNFWPLAGWVTSGVMCGVFAISVNFLSLPIAALLAIASRVLLTGALHEDGLADFCDGMGGGTSRERTLEIMKDSHIGTYGVIGLIVYFALFYFGLREMTMGFLQWSLRPDVACKNPILMTCAALMFSDVWSKCVAAQVVNFLPYARKEEEAKNHVIYQHSKQTQLIVNLVAMVPIVILWIYIGSIPAVAALLLVPAVIFAAIVSWLRHRLGGYTGDCCGAIFLICEVSMLLTWLITLNL